MWLLEKFMFFCLMVGVALLAGVITLAVVLLTR